MEDRRELLMRYLPVLRYDSNETFFADAVEIMAGENDAFQLEQASGELISPSPVPSALLAGKTYGNGKPVSDADRLAGTRRDYREQSAELHPREELRNVVYGHVPSDPDGRVWLQYWYFYLYNDASFAGNVGLHEGDWEMVQLRMDDKEPDLAVYAQHRYSERRAWDAVQREGIAPVVYPARGSHASYFEPGLHRTEAWWDMADGLREAPRSRLVDLDSEPPSWLQWPGRWGATKPRYPWDLDSPPGPSEHGHWHDPRRLLNKAKAHQRLEPPPAPQPSVRRSRGHLAVSFDLQAPLEGLDRADRLVVTVNSPDEQSPPRTYTFSVDQTLQGSLLTSRVLDPGSSYAVRTSIVDIDGKASAASLTRLPALSGLGRILALLGSLSYDLRLALAVLRRRLL
jgi:hypothetical protein